MTKSISRTLPGLKRLGRLAFTGLLLVLAYLIITRLSAIDWAAVWLAMQDYQAQQLLQAAGFVAIGYGTCASYDLISRHILKLPLPATHVAAKSFVGYSFSLNLGAMVGGMGVRYRLYRRSGVATAQILRLMMLGALTNWSGYGLLAGALLWQLPAELMIALGLPAQLPALAGSLLIAASAAYLIFCWRRSGSELQLRGVRIPVPSGPQALLQIGLSLISWTCIISTLQVLMPAGISWPQTGQAVATGALAGAASHVPGGIGVLEYVFVEMLDGQAAAAQVLAAVVVFRALYYLLPCGLALLTYLGLEWHYRHTRAVASG